jgi:hypothetical protein
MIHKEPTDSFRAGFLLAVGSAFGIVGLLLSAGGTAAREVVFADASPALAGLITWGPRSLLAGGGAMVLASTLVLSAGWLQKKG